MADIETSKFTRTVRDGSGISPGEHFYREEIQLALRNRGMPLEALRYPITPTGLHYLLIHFDIPHVLPEEWRLRVEGRVSHPLSLSLEELQEFPARTLAVTLECAGNGRALLEPRPISQPWLLEALGTAEWTGIPLRTLLERAQLRSEAVEILFTGLDQGIQGGEVQYYQRSLSIPEAMREEVLLAFRMNGEPLPPQHGYPLRLIVPGWYGMASVKWLTRIEAIPRPFEGYQMSKTYRYATSEEDPGLPVTEIRVRSLMIPPGIPDFLTRMRLLAPGPVRLQGRAWAGRRAVTRVEVSPDAGAHWHEAQLGPAPSRFAWRGWSWTWEATPGTHTLCVRATDDQGQVQPLDPPWNYQGMGNNMVQRVEVLVQETPLP